jgi:hypothetical protein
MVSFDVVSLFTRVPIKETMNLLGWHFEEDILRIFRHVLTTSYFSFNSQFYEQIVGVAMCSPLSPVIASFYMEGWLHGPDKLNYFLNRLNSITASISAFSSPWRPKGRTTEQCTANSLI